MSATVITFLLPPAYDALHKGTGSEVWCEILLRLP